MKPIHVRLVAILGVILLEAMNMMTTKYDGTMLNLAMVGLLGLAGYDILKKRKGEEENQ
jgi:hypothetical protein